MMIDEICFALMNDNEVVNRARLIEAAIEFNRMRFVRRRRIYLSLIDLMRKIYLELHFITEYSDHLRQSNLLDVDRNSRKLIREERETTEKI